MLIVSQFTQNGRLKMAPNQIAPETQKPIEIGFDHFEVAILGELTKNQHICNLETKTFNLTPILFELLQKHGKPSQSVLAILRQPFWVNRLTIDISVI